MMDQMEPCVMPSPWLHMFIATLQVVQVIAVAYLTKRARRKNRQDSGFTNKRSW